MPSATKRTQALRRGESARTNSQHGTDEPVPAATRNEPARARRRAQCTNELMPEHARTRQPGRERIAKRTQAPAGRSTPPSRLATGTSDGRRSAAAPTCRCPIPARPTDPAARASCRRTLPVRPDHGGVIASQLQRVSTNETGQLEVILILRNQAFGSRSASAVIHIPSTLQGPHGLRPKHCEFGAESGTRRFCDPAAIFRGICLSFSRRLSLQVSRTPLLPLNGPRTPLPITACASPRPSPDCAARSSIRSRSARPATSSSSATTRSSSNGTRPGQARRAWIMAGTPASWAPGPR